MNRLIITAAAALVAAALVAQETSTDPKIVATINGEVLTVEQLDQLWQKLSPQMKANYERSGGKIQYLDNYIRKRLVIQEAMKSDFQKNREVAFELQQARDAALFDRYVRDIVAKSVVSEEDLKTYYNENKSKFQRAEMVKARHIIATPAEGNVLNQSGDDAKTKEEALQKMQNIAQQLQSGGAKFADLAIRYSEDGSAPLYGNLGWAERGKMVPEFEKVVFSLEKGKISHVFETQYGFHVAMVEDRREAGVRPFEEVRGEIREALLQERSDKILAEVTKLTNELRASSKIMVYRENL